MMPTKNPSGQLVSYETTIPVQTVTRPNATDKAMASPGRLVNEARRRGRADHEAEHQQGPDHRYRHAGRQGHDEQESDLHPSLADAPGLGHIRHRGGQHERAEDGR